MIQRIELADGRAIRLAGDVVELQADIPQHVWGYCVHRCGWGYGPRYPSPMPSDQYDLISSHDGCRGPG